MRFDKNCIPLSGSLIRSIYFEDVSPRSSQEFVRQVIETLMNAVGKKGDSPEANIAVKALAKIGEAAMNDLIDQWLSNVGEESDNDTLARIQNTWARMKDDQQEIGEYVISCLNSESEDRLPAFIAASAVIAPEQAIEPIGEILKTHPAASVRAQAVRSLSEIANEKAVKLLNEQLLVEEDVGVLRELVDRVKVTSESVSGFCKQIKHLAWPIRERVARALGEASFDDPAITQALEVATADENSEVIQAAIESLRSIGSVTAENALKKVLDDAGRPLEIRGAALEALKELRAKQAA
jgi:HEAT repeat protein